MLWSIFQDTFIPIALVRQKLASSFVAGLWAGGDEEQTRGFLDSGSHCWMRAGISNRRLSGWGLSFTASSLSSVRPLTEIQR